jgi:pimeloyl-ACP methyl ester carboxylesterase
MQRAVELSANREATYYVIGSGPPMLWFEGGPGLSPAASLPDAQLLAERYTIHLLDPHGSGGSTPPADPSGYSFDGYARFYEEVREALGLGPVTVLGHSFGGSVALCYAALHPEATAACIVVSGKVLGLEAEVGESRAERERGLRRHADAPWYPAARRLWDECPERVLATEDPAEVEAMLAAMAPLYVAHPDRPRMRSRLDQLARDRRVDLVAAKAWMSGDYLDIDVRPVLAEIRCPTLLIAGELDLRAGPSQARYIAERVAGAELHVIPDCGHCAQFEAPDAFRETVLDWAARRDERLVRGATGSGH